MHNASHLPDYGNQQITEIIKEYVHDKTDRKILYLYFVDGISIRNIATTVDLDPKTVWSHLQKQEKVIFSHIPYESEDGE